ncbi:unnamed protein product [Pedinophyceae sp. YPF-701]|nr:unnamed protein product [Pedinophyceae sp. YPF-701]
MGPPELRALAGRGPRCVCARVGSAELAPCRRPLLRAAHARPCGRRAAHGWGRCRRMEQALRVRATPSSPAVETELAALIESAGVESSVVVTAHWDDGGGRSLVGAEVPNPKLAKPDAERGQCLLRVPLEVCLSFDLPGASPSVREAAEMQPLLSSDAPWEIKLAGMMLYAARCGDSSAPECAFWSTYINFIPRDLASVLVLTQDELELTCDNQLQQRAAQWKKWVERAFREYFVPGRPLAGACKGLDDLLWAVAAVETRAFGARGSAAGDTQAHTLVPVLDMANHEPLALSHHAPDPATNTYALFCYGPVPAPGQDVPITYGARTNRDLMEQYGFFLRGNPSERIDLPEALREVPRSGGIFAADAHPVRLSRARVIHVLGLGDDSGAEPTGGALEEMETERAGRVIAAGRSLLASLGWGSMKAVRGQSDADEEGLLRQVAAWAEEEARAKLAELAGALGATVEGAGDVEGGVLVLEDAVASAGLSGGATAAAGYAIESVRMLEALREACEALVAAGVEEAAQVQPRDEAALLGRLVEAHGAGRLEELMNSREGAGARGVAFQAWAAAQELSDDEEAAVQAAVFLTQGITPPPVSTERSLSLERDTSVGFSVVPGEGEVEQAATHKYGMRTLGPASRTMLSPKGGQEALVAADALGTSLAVQRRRSAVELVGRKYLNPGEAAIPATVNAASRILEALMSIPDADERAAMLPEAFTPPSDDTPAAREGEDLLYTTPVVLLQAVDLELLRSADDERRVAELERLRDDVAWFCGF